MNDNLETEVAPNEIRGNEKLGEIVHEEPGTVQGVVMVFNLLTKPYGEQVRRDSNR